MALLISATRAGLLRIAASLQGHSPEFVNSGPAVQYACEAYRAVLERHGITPSMSRRGNCLVNAPMKSFFASLKTEHLHQVRFRTREEARVAVFDYVKVFYNRQRLHSGIGYRTPAQARADMSEVSISMAA